MAEETQVTDYSLANPDTLTKYKTAGQISQNVLQTVSGWCTEGAKIVEICQRGDKLLSEEIAKVFKGKKIAKGISHPCTISPSSYVTPYTPLTSDAEEAERTLKASEAVKIQLGAQIDGFGTIVGDTVIVGGKVEGREADLLLANYWANELLLRTMLPPGLLAAGSDEEKKKAQVQKPYGQSKITQLLEKLVKSYDCSLVENTTCWLFGRNEIEDKKKIILAPGEGVKGEGVPDVSEAWGVEIGVSLGSGKVKSLPDRATLHRRTTIQYGLKRPSSRATLSEVQKKFGTFPFSLRQLDDERAGKVGVVECVRSGTIRQYEVIGSSDSQPVARLFTTVAITKNGIQKLSAPPALDLEKVKSDKKITDEEVLKILEQPISKVVTKKNKPKKKKKAAKKPAAQAGGQDEESEEESSDE
ncbi:curved DNA-binding protein [Polychaeton citri CBS 116435]|uniref:Curved DNA-binding protein n=1 Tax=Polychaeton citri CBS 116435 TaxID=1314669 RepID=A0A9P4QCK2_9PEZI|nr:curved DNA-binding protein [Polychaeton citri CBS 116435]